MASDQVLRWYQTPALSAHKTTEALRRLQSVSPLIQDLDTEHCIYAQIRGKKNKTRDPIFSSFFVTVAKVKLILSKVHLKSFQCYQV